MTNPLFSGKIEYSGKFEDSYFGVRILEYLSDKRVFFPGQMLAECTIEGNKLVSWLGSEYRSLEEEISNSQIG